MQDDRLWGFEQSLWLEGRENYREKVNPEVLVVLPRPPHVLAGDAASQRWKRHRFGIVPS